MGIAVEPKSRPSAQEEDTVEPPAHALPRAFHRAPRNLRGHWLRNAQRVVVLVTADLATYWVLRETIRALRDGALGGTIASVVSQLFAQGFLGGAKFAAALLLSLLIAGAYGAGELRRDTGRVLSGAALAALISLYSAAWSQHPLLVLVQFAATVAVVGSALVGVRKLVDLVVRRVRRGRGGARTVLVAHEGANWTRLEELIDGGGELRLVARVRLPDRADAEGSEILAGLADRIVNAEADTVLLWTDLSEDEFAYAVDVALASGCRLLAGPRSPTRLRAQPRAAWVDGWPLVELTAPGLKAWQLVAKRIIDIAGATAGLLILSPLLLVAGAWVRLDSPGPVLFGQMRVGVRGRAFRMLKFRSMRPDAEEMLRADPELNRLFHENGFKIPAELDPRLTRSGRVLRKTSVDELPQLLNVLAGSMSLVGPRPIEPVELEHNGHHYGSHGMPVFLSVKPGITGAWAVNGRSSVGYPDRAQMELDYIRSWSIGSDLMLLLRTLPAIVSRRGAH